MVRRSVSFPESLYEKIKREASDKPHYTENAIIIDLVQAGMALRDGPAARAPKRARRSAT